MITISVRNLPRTMTEKGLEELFSQFGTVRGLKLSKDLFSGECRGFATVDMEGHEAREAMAALDGREIDGRSIRVEKEKPRFAKGRRR
jgi:RNA recognition motif-containing protein